MGGGQAGDPVARGVEQDRVAGVSRLDAEPDGPDDAVERAYTGWPDRLYVIDKSGRVAHKSAAGPFGFKPADVEATLKRLLR